MLIVCPSCASEYTIDPDRVGADGRTVRCASCRSKWWVGPAGDGWDEASLPPEAPPAPVPREDPPLAVEATSSRAAPPPKPRRRARGGAPARRPGPVARALGSLPSGLLLAILWLAILVGGVAGRAHVVQALPETARLYAGLGLPVNLRGIEIRDVRSEVSGTGAEAFLTVEGELRGLGSRSASVPPIQIAVQDETATPFYTWTVDPPRETLAPGETARFRARLAAPPPESRQVLVRFAPEARPGTAPAR